MECRIYSLYLCVKDMERAVAFYEDFFEQPAAVKDSVYSVFDIHGFRLGLFAYEKMHEPHTFGTSCLPSISVESKEVLQYKLEQLKVVFPITKIGSNWVAEFADSEGNSIELTAPAENEKEAAKVAISCPCKRTKCERRGDCEACRAHHAEKHMRTACERLQEKAERKQRNKKKL